MVDDSELRFEIEFLSGPDDGEVKRLYSREVIIGSEQGVDLLLASDTAASERHAKIQRTDDGFWIEDLGSKGGTIINGDKITEKRQIGPFDVVCIGNTEFICRFPRPENIDSSMVGTQTKTPSNT